MGDPGLLGPLGSIADTLTDEPFGGPDFLSGAGTGGFRIAR
jgi:hypothetical protein